MTERLRDMSVEIQQRNTEFERTETCERERKYIPIFPEMLEKYRPDSYPIEQFYLSRLDEPFSLRIRETLQRGGELSYEITLKDDGFINAGGELDRIEFPAPTEASLYHYYKQDAPVIRKLRTDILPKVAVDFYEDGSVQLEAEDKAQWQQFVDMHGDYFIEVTGDISSTNEWKAHKKYREEHEGTEAYPRLPELRADDIVNDIIRTPAVGPRIVHIGGRSGSGKSTIVAEVCEKLDRIGMASVVLSTDDYHRGTRWLVEYNGGQPWEHWDDRVVYDTNAMSADLARLVQGEPIPRREIDWSVAEPVITGTIQPAEVIIIEGIYAQSPDITSPNDLSYKMPTPLATCVGRRLLRDLRERPEFSDPAKSLSYILREAEPAYRKQLAKREISS